MYLYEELKIDVLGRPKDVTLHMSFRNVLMMYADILNKQQLIFKYFKH